MLVVVIELKYLNYVEGFTLICSQVLTAKSREKDGELFCLRCHDRAASICACCHKPIEGRIIHAIGKTWHPEVKFSYLPNIKIHMCNV